MNREILKSMDTGHIPVQRLTALLETFTLKHAARMLPDLLETADLQDSSAGNSFWLFSRPKSKGGMNGAGSVTIPQRIFHQISDRWKSLIRKSWSQVSPTHSSPY